MKERFSTLDIVCAVAELQKLIGMRVNSIYDVDQKTYLIKLQKPECKEILLFESGNRIHTTSFEWPKHTVPSGFSMKLRKHLRNKRLESLRQLGADRIVEMQFGTNEATYHVILELYDRGNIILTDYEWTILSILRPFIDDEEVKYMVKEKYPLQRVREKKSADECIANVRLMVREAKLGDNLKRKLIPMLECGPSLLEHVLTQNGFSNATKIGKGFDCESDFERLEIALREAFRLMDALIANKSKGYIVKKKETQPDETEFWSYQEFHPFLFAQFENQSFDEFGTFLMAVDEFFSNIENQKIELKSLKQEKNAVKKLENVRSDHDQRLKDLEIAQNVDKIKAELITRNFTLVENAILAIRTALANQLSWFEIETQLKEAQNVGNEMSLAVKQLKLQTNQITLMLSDIPPEDDEEDEENEEGEEKHQEEPLPSMLVDIDLGLSSFANARKYYDLKRFAAKKHEKTIESQTKAMKSAERKAKQNLKEVNLTSNINKARKTFWFEKFYWFISSENYLVIGGRDQIQNELIVKRYLKANDVYVHADISGASSVVIKNSCTNSESPIVNIPPKTLNEAATMAVCYSVAWEANVITSAYWVYAHQVSKAAPTGEYLTTGSFMIRGKKNYLQPPQLAVGFAILFKLEESSIERHLDDRKIKITEDLQSDAVNTSNDFHEVEENDDEGGEHECEHDGEHEELENDNNGDSEEESLSEDETESKAKSFSGFRNMKTIVKDCDTDLVDRLRNAAITNQNQAQNVKDTRKTKPKKVRFEAVKKPEESLTTELKQPSQVPVKRGQRSKLKKIKEKYKDQDDEERELRMKLLQSDGPPKIKKKDLKKGSKRKRIGPSEQTTIVKQPLKGILVVPKTEAANEIDPVDADVDDNNDNNDNDEENSLVNSDINVLNSLTGVPVTEDELLFAIPVVAPYHSIVNYKYKLKLTPGRVKRGNAARSAAKIFQSDKSATVREKDLIRAVKDEVLVRNLPAKVKIFAPKVYSSKK